MTQLLPVTCTSLLNNSASAYLLCGSYIKIYKLIQNTASVHFDIFLRDFKIIIIIIHCEMDNQNYTRNTIRNVAPYSNNFVDEFRKSMINDYIIET